MTNTERQIVVDTNVILFDALAITKFQDADIHIPFSVIEEVDRFKRDLGETGRNARQFSRFIDVLRSKGSLAKGVLLEGGSSKVHVTRDNDWPQLPEELGTSTADNRILGTALSLTAGQLQWLCGVSYQGHQPKNQSRCIWSLRKRLRTRTQSLRRGLSRYQGNGSFPSSH